MYQAGKGDKEECRAQMAVLEEQVVVLLTGTAMKWDVDKQGMAAASKTFKAAFAQFYQAVKHG